jgi:VanZ family protein
MFVKHMKWAMFWALIILILCGIPGRDIPHISFLELLSFDKFVHAGIFFVLILLTIRGFVLQSAYFFIKRNAKPLALIICILYGGSLEIMQGTLFEDRSADIYDFTANSLGCLVGVFFYNKIEDKVLKKILN